MEPQPNRAPDAVNDSETTEFNTPVSINVLGNDSDPDGDPLSVTSVEGQSITPGQTIDTTNGSVTLLNNGQLEFTPDAGFSGNETFSYHISDGNGGEDTADVNVHVEKAKVDLSIHKEATNVTKTRYSHYPVVYNDDIAFPFDMMRYDITVKNNSDQTATGVVVEDIVPENIDLWEPGQTISDTGYSWNTHHPHWGGRFTGSPEVIDPTNGNVTITDPGTAPHGLNLPIGQTYGLPEGSVVWELGDSLAPGESVTLSYFGMREVYNGYNWKQGTQFFTEASIVEVDQHDTNSSNDSDSARSWWISPLALDLNGDGVQTLSIDEGVEFDMLNSGSKVNTGWLSGEDGFLAIDNNGNGQIDDRSELFGGSKGEGFAKLASLDSNGDGLVNENDALFGALKVWQDGNENGITDEGELVSLESVGITDLNTAYTDVFAADAQGNIHGEHSSALKKGSTIDMVDVYFQVEAG